MDAESRNLLKAIFQKKHPEHIDDAITLGERGLINHPNDPILMGRLADAYMYRGDLRKEWKNEDYTHAIELFEIAFLIEPDNYANISLYTKALVVQRQFEKAINFSQPKLDDNPSLFNNWLLCDSLGLAYLGRAKQNWIGSRIYAQIDLQEARKLLERSETLQAEFNKSSENKFVSTAKLGLAEIAIREENYDEVIRLLPAEQNLDENTPNRVLITLAMAYKELAKQHFEAEEIEKGGELANQALNIVVRSNNSSTNAAFYDQKLQILEILGRQEEAFKLADEMIKKFPKDEAASRHYRRLSLRQSSGGPDGAPITGTFAERISPMMGVRGSMGFGNL
jgi:tetratricopeptide (TPR) repeat protein